MTEGEWEKSTTHHPRDWHNRPSTASGSSNVSGSSSSQSSALSQRRRSSAAHALVPPTAPPPNQPIPSVPVVSPIYFDRPPGISEEEDMYLPHHQNGATNFGVNSFSRPSGSANLVAVAAFSEARQASSANGQSHLTMNGSSSPEILSDSPPRSLLHPSSSRVPAQHQEIIPDRLLLSPPQRVQTESRPSSRRALTQALELAREAVKLDSTSDDPYGAVMAYSRSVALLSEVMERVRRGEDSTETHRRRNGRRRSVVAQEEEVRRLKTIHDTYADRMNILSLIYSIPPIPHSPASVYASSMFVSTDSTQPPSPSSNSPPSDTDPVQRIPYTTDPIHDDVRRLAPRGVDTGDATEAIGSAMFNLDNSVPFRGSTQAVSSSYHPYAAASPYAFDSSAEAEAASPAPVSALHRNASAPNSQAPVRRSRASSALPPPPPPPLTSPPPAPARNKLPPDLLSSKLSSVSVPRENTAGDIRAGTSGKLAALEEEAEKYDGRRLRTSQDSHPGYEQDIPEADLRGFDPDTPRNIKRDDPLPPLPSPSSQASSVSTNSLGTPRNSVLAGQPPPGNAVTEATRATSALSASEMWSLQSQQHLINSSTMMGTISQRRSKTSAPPLRTRSPSPADSTASAGSAGPSRLTASSLPANTATSLGIGRSRAVSQPGRRPSLVGGRVSPLDHRSLPSTAGLNGANVPRKTSFPSKLNPNLQPPQLAVQTDLSTNSLIPPPPIFPGNLPTTPTSPLPTAPPSDALRKPYHMMNLLRTTMTSRTGGYVTRRLHVPQEVWSQGGAKLANVLEKVRVIEVLCSALEDLQHCSVEYFGAGNVNAGMTLGVGSVGRREGEAWIAKLEEFSSICDGVVANFGKKLGIGEGFVLKKTSGVTSWGGKLTRQLDKFTNGKNLDSPAAYVQGLIKLFVNAQLLDEHTRALSSQPVAASYAAFPVDIRGSVELKLKRSSEFFASVVLTFVIRDLSQLLDKYAKKCEKWLAE